MLHVFLWGFLCVYLCKYVRVCAFAIHKSHTRYFTRSGQGKLDFFAAQRHCIFFLGSTCSRMNTALLLFQRPSYPWKVKRHDGGAFGLVFARTKSLQHRMYFLREHWAHTYTRTPSQGKGTPYRSVPRLSMGPNWQNFTQPTVTYTWNVHLAPISLDSNPYWDHSSTHSSAMDPNWQFHTANTKKKTTPGMFIWHQYHLIPSPSWTVSPLFQKQLSWVRSPQEGKATELSSLRADEVNWVTYSATPPTPEKGKPSSVVDDDNCFSFLPSISGPVVKATRGIPQCSSSEWFGSLCVAFAVGGQVLVYCVTIFGGLPDDDSPLGCCADVNHFFLHPKMQQEKPFKLGAATQSVAVLPQAQPPMGICSSLCCNGFGNVYHMKHQEHLWNAFGMVSAKEFQKVFQKSSKLYSRCGVTRESAKPLT